MNLRIARRCAVWFLMFSILQSACVERLTRAAAADSLSEGIKRARAVLPQGPFADLKSALDQVGEKNLDDCIKLRDGRLLMVFRVAGPAIDASTDATPTTTFGAYSRDHGLTWDEPFAMHAEDGQEIRIPVIGSLLELPSGALGYYYQGSDTRPGREGSYQWWRKSSDGGRTWSAPSPMLSDPDDERARYGRGLVEQGASHYGKGLVLPDGRIVIPASGIMYGPILPRQEDKDWHQTFGEGTAAFQWGLDHFGTLIYGFCFLSDDEGVTWRRSLTDVFIVLPGRYPVQPQGRGGFYNFEETSAIALRDGRVMMLGRSILGRPFVSFSKDKGVTFFQPEPLNLASPDAPSMLTRIPDTGDILLIWNQTSVKENVEGYSRHRLSTAISQDEGQTWGHFRNLESLDEVTHIKPPQLGAERWDPQQPIDPQAGLHGVGGAHYLQPTDRQRYVRAPGPLRAAYPHCRIVDDTVIVRYDLGSTPPDTVVPRRKVQRILPVRWFYEGKLVEGD